ncbi:hypothetical protein SORBI_3003G079532 [Sorghum bicolor]|uniref:Uncharacterized protein n=1 Tax=Sorghum bicolor TaxID=4558 RepID=A0A1W0VW51_SORBI|nr:hypothetical protein SORBI_3003G079532 [Sorghum bicolor]
MVYSCSEGRLRHDPPDQGNSRLQPEASTRDLLAPRPRPRASRKPSSIPSVFDFPPNSKKKKTQPSLPFSRTPGARPSIHAAAATAGPPVPTCVAPSDARHGRHHLWIALPIAMEADRRANQTAAMEGKSMVMSTLGIRIGVRLGLTSTPWDGASSFARDARVTVEWVEQHLRCLLTSTAPRAGSPSTSSSTISSFLLRFILKLGAYFQVCFMFAYEL